MHAQRNNLWSALWSGTEGKKPVAPATAANFTASSTNSTADATTGNEFNCPVVFGMDFGTAETGTAYAMRNVGNKSEQPFIGLCAPLGKPVDLDTMCLVNTTTRITEASFVRHKVTTSLLVKEKSVVRGSVETMEVIAFGPEAETEYAALSLERQGNYLLFRQFKMQLLSQHKVSHRGVVFCRSTLTICMFLCFWTCVGSRGRLWTNSCRSNRIDFVFRTPKVINRCVSPVGVVGQ